MKNWWKMYLIVVVALVSAVIAYPKEERILRPLGIDRQLSIERGLDLQGGAHLVFEAQFAEGEDIDSDQALESLESVINRRVNPAGTTGVNIQASGENRLIVELPGVDDVNAAIQQIGRIAELIFLEATPEGTVLQTNLTGEDIKQANPDIDPNSGAPIVSFEFKSSAAVEFAQLTTRLFNNGGSLITLLDGQVILNAPVSSPITDGRGIISGGFETIQDARDTAELLNSGPLSVPIELVEQRTVGPTLGQASIDASVMAASVGLGLVALFLLYFYRIGGVLAVFALGLYMTMTISIYKLSVHTPYGIVLTLAGIAGLILSIGVATDGTILFIERAKEELRKGAKLRDALPRSYESAWVTIKEANFATFLSCLILYYFGASLIKGFAVTLGIGVLLNLVIARWVLRPLIDKMAVSQRIKPSWFEPLYKPARFSKGAKK